MKNAQPFSFKKLISSALCAALVGVLCGQAFAETGRAELTVPERMEWAAAGFAAEDAAEWKYYGIGSVDAKSWINAGIIYPAWANQWIGEGFGPQEAGLWKDVANVYTAGKFKKHGFGAAEAIEWIKNGVPAALRASEFKAAGLGPTEGGEFWRLGIYPEEAGEWSRGGFIPAETIDWRFGPKDVAYFHTKKSPSSRRVYKLEWAQRWRAAGFSAADARWAEDCGVALDTAVKWKGAGFTADETVKWRDSGFGIDEASAMRTAGIDAAEAEEKRDAQNPAQADSITRFHSDITLKPDGTLVVIETIEFQNAPEGVYNDCFYKATPGSPGIIELKYGANHHRVSKPSYTFISASVDGIQTGFEKKSNGIFCIGGGSPLSNGAHSFTVRYITNDRLIIFNDHDELSFDVLGGYRDDTTRRNVSATVRLPRGAEIIFTDGRAGLPGRRDFSVKVEETPDGDVAHYRVTRPIKDKMDFRVSVAFLKGYVDQGLLHRAKKLDHKTGRLLTSLAIFLAGFGAALAYYVIAWRSKGVDPVSAPVVIEFSASEGMSPAKARLLHTTGKVDLLSASSSLVALAERGCVKISESRGKYELSRSSCPAPADALEAAFLERFFAGADSVTTDNGGAQRRLKAALGILKKGLKNEFKNYYSTNAKALLPGIGMSLLTIAACLIVVDWGSFHSNEAMKVGVFYGIFLTTVFGTLAEVFRRFLRAPTAAYVKLKGRLDGYRAYLEANHPKSSGRMTGLSPQMQRHLSYAMALGIGGKYQMIPEGRAQWFKGSSGGFSSAEFLNALKRKG